MTDPLSRPLTGFARGPLIGRVGEGLIYGLEGGSAADMQLRLYAPVDPQLEPSPALAEALARGAEAFLALGRRLIDLRDRHVGRVYEVIERDGRAFWVIGAPGLISLEQRLQSPAGGAALSPGEVGRLAADMAAGLTALHRAGLLHRDVAPQTVVRGADGSWVLTACSTDRRVLMKPSGRQDGLYRPSYAAPEMQDGSLRAPLSPATDLYGLCASLHHAIAGRAPPTWMERLCGAPSLSNLAPAGYPSALLALVDQGVVARPGDRFTSVEAWWEAARPHVEALSGTAVAPAFLAADPLAAVAAAVEAVAAAAPSPPRDELRLTPPAPRPAFRWTLPPVRLPAARIPPIRLPAVRSLSFKPGALAWLGRSVAIGAAAAALAAGAGWLAWRALKPHPTPWWAVRSAVVRAAPDAHAPELDRRPRGAKLAGKLEPTSSGTPWLKLDLGGGRTGYVSTKSLGHEPPPALDDSQHGPRRLSKDETARQAPKPDAPAAEALVEGGLVRLAGRTPDGWWEVLRSSGGVEYLPADAFTPTAADTPAVSKETETPPPGSGQAAARQPAPSPSAAAPAAPEPRKPPMAEAAVPPPPPPPVLPEIRRVAVLKKPTAEDVQRVYPRAALGKGQAGSALIDCMVASDGAMRDCTSVGANPPGQGFEEAARALGALYVVSGVDQEGHATPGRRITFEVKFQPR